MSKQKIQRYFDHHGAESDELPKPQNVKEKHSKTNEKVESVAWGTRFQDKFATKTKRKVYSKVKIPVRGPIAPELLEKHSRGEGLNKTGVRTGIHKRKLQRKEDNIKFANELAARAELLLSEEPGFLQADAGETTTQFTQKQIAGSVDITAAAKQFELRLNDFGPYRACYTRNGRHLLLGGRLGHVAAFDWVTKKLHFEVNVMESIHDVCWLHIETMLAVAQKNWVYIYDNQGIELHCLKQLNKIQRMEFLPYHFLLATASDEGYLSWLDVSIGQMVTQYNTRFGRLNMLAQNPHNAVLCLGSAKGVVSMWTPNTPEPVAKMLCHKSAMSALHVDPRGVYLATAGCDRSLKIWDVRKLHGPIQIYNLRSVAGNLAFSQSNMLAVGMGNLVEIYRDSCLTSVNRAYLRHRMDGNIGNFNFCPYEDILGIANARGFTSILVPGAGEANFDAYEANPYQTKSQRREAEVKALLEKIPADLIALDPQNIVEVDVPTLKDKVEAKKKLLFVKPPKINYEPRNKAKGKGGSVKIARNKKIVREDAKKEFIKTMKDSKLELNDLLETDSKKNVKVKKTVPKGLDRFLPKQKVRTS